MRGRDLRLAWQQGMFALSIILSTVQESKVVKIIHHQRESGDERFAVLTLRGMQDSYFAIDHSLFPLPEELEFGPLKVEMINLLEANGVHILSEDGDPVYGSPILSIGINGLKLFDTGPGLWVLSVEFKVRQLVRLERDPTIKTGTTTWQTSILGGAPGDRLMEVLNKMAVDAVEKFVAVYKSVNAPGE